MMNLAKLLMATPAVMLLGVDFARRIQEATNPQRQVVMITFVLEVCPTISYYSAISYSR